MCRIFLCAGTFQHYFVFSSRKKKQLLPAAGKALGRSRHKGVGGENKYGYAKYKYTKYKFTKFIYTKYKFTKLIYTKYKIYQVYLYQVCVYPLPL